jgi:hypothetical protein
MTINHRDIFSTQNNNRSTVDEKHHNALCYLQNPFTQNNDGGLFAFTIYSTIRPYNIVMWNNVPCSVNTTLSKEYRIA